MVDYRYYEELEDEAFEGKIKPKENQKNKRKNGRNLTMSLKGIKRLVSYGLISLTGFNLFVGCSSPFEPELSTIEFVLDARMEKDSNGYYHLTLDTTKWRKHLID